MYVGVNDIRATSWLDVPSSQLNDRVCALFAGPVVAMFISEIAYLSDEETNVMLGAWPPVPAGYTFTVTTFSFTLNAR